MFKKVMSLICATCMLVSMSIPAFAQNTKTDISSIPEEKILNIPDNASHVEVGDAEYIRTPQGNIFKVSELESFSTMDEASNFANQMFNNITHVDHTPSINLNSRITRGDVVLDEVLISSFGYVKLHLSYTTSGDGHTGEVTRYDPYTTYAGFTYAVEWEEEYCCHNLWQDEV